MKNKQIILLQDFDFTARVEELSSYRIKRQGIFRGFETLWDFVIGLVQYNLFQWAN